MRRSESFAKQVGAPPVSPLDLIKVRTGIDKGFDDTRSPRWSSCRAKIPKASRPLCFSRRSAVRGFLESFGAKPTSKIVEVKIGGENCLVGKIGSYAAITAPEKGFREGLEKAIDSKRSVADDYPQLIPWLAKTKWLRWRPRAV